jgi:hypothetical protein
MDRREEKATLLAAVTHIRNQLEAQSAAGTLPTSGPEWDDLQWARSEVRRVTAELAEFDRIQKHAASAKTGTRAPSGQSSALPAGRPVTPEAMEHLASVHRRAAERQGHAIQGARGFPLMNALAALAMVPARMLPADLVRRLLPRRTR